MDRNRLWTRDLHRQMERNVDVHEGNSFAGPNRMNVGEDSQLQTGAYCLNPPQSHHSVNC
jgi:hypothetical protein